MNTILTNEDVLDYIADMIVERKPPPGYYNMRQIYEYLQAKYPELQITYDRARNIIRKRVESGDLKVHYIGRNVYYGIKDLEFNEQIKQP